MFVPSRWWHSARVVTTSVSVCTNIMHSANWAGFVDLSCETTDGKASPGKMVKRVYLQLAGLLMSAVEKLQETFPDSAVVRRIGHLSPATPAARR
jgi:hypothetical protein